MTNSRWLVLAAILAAGACTNQEIVYRDRPPFNPPVDSVNGFLGYFTSSTKQTTCGNCHAGVQANWVNTKHAVAWSDLQASGHPSSSCYACHTVSQNGNFTTDSLAGYPGHHDSAYYDVQCENCHGPGYAHVQNPTQATEPLATMNVIDSSSGTVVLEGCGKCHTGTHEPFVDQWKQSAHGAGTALAHAGGEADCQPCHEGRQAMIQKFGVSGNFLERDQTTPERITCIVCHDPHGSQYPGQLRASISVHDSTNLCITCHSRRAAPPWGWSTRGASSAHGGQGPLVIGKAGWIPPGFNYDSLTLVSSHGSDANPGLCATCHVAQHTVTDQLTGAFKFQSVGHLFNAIPCTDSTGIPTADENCTLPQRDFSACVAGGCHNSTTSAMAAYQAADATINNMLDQIWVDKNGNKVVDATDGGLLAQMVARGLPSDTAALNFTDTTVTTVAEGTLYNATLAATAERPYFLSGTVFGKKFSAHMASGNGAHNPFLLEALLSASISAMQSTYSLAAPPVRIQVTATQPPAVRVRGQ